MSLPTAQDIFSTARQAWSVVTGIRTPESKEFHMASVDNLVKVELVLSLLRWAETQPNSDAIVEAIAKLTTAVYRSQ